MKQRKPKRDFLFIDESGDPNIRGSNYYCCSLIHVTDADIGYLSSVVSDFRFFYNYHQELHSHKLSVSRLAKLNMLLRRKRRHFKASVVFLDKAAYKGFYLRDRGRRKASSNLFRKYIYRQVIDFHFGNFEAATRHVELVFDRSNLSHNDISNLISYLQKWSRLPKTEKFVEVDSKYVDLIQVADLIAYFFTPGILDKKENGFSHSFIHHKDITYENARGERY